MNMLWLVILVAVEIPKPVGWVNDFADVIPQEVEQQIDHICTYIKQQTGAELAVVSITTTEGIPLRDYGVELYEKWGIGEEAKDNGVLFIAAIADRRVEIITGYGVEGILPDGLCGEILDKYVVPYFKRKDYGGGFLAGTLEIGRIIAEDAGVEFPPPDVSYDMPVVPATRQRMLPWGLLLLLFIFVGWRILPMLFFMSLPGYWISGRGGFGSGFSSFGGFGGGLTGGGGAGRSW